MGLNQEFRLDILNSCDPFDCYNYWPTSDNHNIWHCLRITQILNGVIYCLHNSLVSIGAYYVYYNTLFDCYRVCQLCAPFTHFAQLLRSLGIVNIMKVYIERSNMQVELRFRKNIDFIHVYS